MNNNIFTTITEFLAQTPHQELGEEVLQSLLELPQEATVVLHVRNDVANANVWYVGEIIFKFKFHIT